MAHEKHRINIVSICSFISMDSFQKLEITDCLEMGHRGELRMGLDGEVIEAAVSKGE